MARFLGGMVAGGCLGILLIPLILVAACWALVRVLPWLTWLLHAVTGA